MDVMPLKAILNSYYRYIAFLRYLGHVMLYVWPTLCFEITWTFADMEDKIKMLV